MPTATIAPPVDPFTTISAISTAAKRDQTKAVETIRSCLSAMLLGESVDAKPFANAMRELGLNEDDVRGHLEALKSAPDTDSWAGEYERRLAAVNEIQATWNLTKQEELRLAWLAAKRKYDAAANELRLITQEHQQIATFIDLNRFLFADDLEAAAEAANVPAITLPEAAHISQDRYPGPAADKLRRDKQAAREQKSAAPTLSPNAVIGKSNCDVPRRP